jgi:hypothetical protein
VFQLEHPVQVIEGAGSGTSGMGGDTIRFSMSGRADSIELAADANVSSTFVVRDPVRVATTAAGR